MSKDKFVPDYEFRQGAFAFKEQFSEQPESLTKILETLFRFKAEEGDRYEVARLCGFTETELVLCYCYDPGFSNRPENRCMFQLVEMKSPHRVFEIVKRLMTLYESGVKVGKTDALNRITGAFEKFVSAEE